MEDDDIFTADEMEQLTEAERQEILDEMRLSEQLGMGADGSAMHLSDDAWEGGAWEPEANDG